MTQAADRSTSSEHRTCGVEHDPDLALGGGNGRLVNIAEQTPIVAGRLLPGRLWRRRNIRNDTERQAPVRAERYRHHILDLVQVGHKEIAVLIERETGITAGVAQVVVVADDARRPRRAAVKAHSLEHSSSQSCFTVSYICHNHDVVAVGGIDRDRLFGLVEVSLAHIHVLRCATFWTRRTAR